MNVSAANRLDLFTTFYDRYASALYGEITRNLYDQTVCEQTLVNAYKEIWEKLPYLNPTKDNVFIWCLQITRKQISKNKIDLLLKEIFTCQQNPQPLTVV